MAQAHPFVYSVVPQAGPLAPRAITFADLGYGRDLFAALGPERLEQRAGAQLRLGNRTTLLAQIGWAVSDQSVDSRASAQAELLASVTQPAARAVFAIGVGGMRDYRATGVALARVIAGYRWSHSLLIGNVRLEHPFARSDRADPRDVVDVITTLGYAREMSSAVRLGLEFVGEDLEGLVERDESEGGAKIMVGPSLGLAPRDARWFLGFTGGPVLRVSRSTIAGSSSGAARDLGTGYVLRTTLGFHW